MAAGFHDVCRGYMTKKSELNRANERSVYILGMSQSPIKLTIFFIVCRSETYLKSSIQRKWRILMKEQCISYKKMRRKASIPIYRNVKYAWVGLGDITFFIAFSSFYLSKSCFSGLSLQEIIAWNKCGLKKYKVCGPPVQIE